MDILFHGDDVLLVSHKPFLLKRGLKTLNIVMKTNTLSKILPIRSLLKIKAKITKIIYLSLQRFCACIFTTAYCLKVHFKHFFVFEINQHCSEIRRTQLLISFLVQLNRSDQLYRSAKFSHKKESVLCFPPTKEKDCLQNVYGRNYVMFNLIGAFYVNYNLMGWTGKNKKN